jgi:hypothetical protein
MEIIKELYISFSLYIYNINLNKNYSFLGISTLVKETSTQLNQNKDCHYSQIFPLVFICLCFLRSFVFHYHIKLS